jgi:DNA-binding Xre family transcriptional regulator
MTFTEKLDLLMRERNINKSILSKESGIPYTTIDGFYKKGSENIKLSTLRSLAAYFDCSLDYLVDDTITNKKPLTIAAHFDGEKFTKEELEEIKQFAEFVKNRRK